MFLFQNRQISWGGEIKLQNTQDVEKSEGVSKEIHTNSIKIFVMESCISGMIVNRDGFSKKNVL